MDVAQEVLLRGVPLSKEVLLWKRVYAYRSFQGLCKKGKEVQLRKEVRPRKDGMHAQGSGGKGGYRGVAEGKGSKGN